MLFLLINDRTTVLFLGNKQRTVSVRRTLPGSLLVFLFSQSVRVPVTAISTKTTSVVVQSASTALTVSENSEGLVEP